MGTMSQDEDRRRTAYHEAGHCVAAVLRGHTLRSVRTVPAGQVALARGRP